jgi:hypothetical protein
MKRLVDVNMPLFVLIDEIKNGSIDINDLTEEQIDSLPSDIKQIAIDNA